MKSWIQRLSKDQLIIELPELGITTKGTIDDLRHRMRAYVTNNRHTERRVVQIAEKKLTKAIRPLEDRTTDRKPR